MLPTPESTLDISVILDIVDAEIAPLLDLDVIEGNSLLIENVTDYPWTCIGTNTAPLKFEDIWKMKLIRKGYHLYVPLSTPTQLLCTMDEDTEAS